MESMIKKNDQEFIMGTYGRQDVVLVSGKGSLLYDEDGKEYIDFGSGIAVNVFGMADEEWAKVVGLQAAKLQHVSNYYYSQPCADLAKLLCEKTAMRKVFFSNSGAEANECAIKAARKYGTDKSEVKNIILTLKESFHGRTVTTIAATGQPSFHTSFTPFTQGFDYITANDIEELREAAKPETIAAIMLEVVQGEGGVNVLDREFLEEVERITTERDILLIIDEVQTGNGRSGQLYAYMNFGLTPDIVSTAKGIGGGLPLGATMFAESLKGVLPVGSHGSTFGGNPVCCAGGLNIISRLDEKLLAEVREKSEYIIKRLESMDGVKGTSGLGLMIGIEIEKDAKEILKLCAQKGLLILTAKSKLRILPALNIGYAEIDRGLDILAEALAEV